jgi:hypothetical protein
VKDRERGTLGDGRDQQIRDARTAMLALPRQKLHHVNRAIEVTLFDIDRGQGASRGLDLTKVGVRAL